MCFRLCRVNCWHGETGFFVGVNAYKHACAANLISSYKEYCLVTNSFVSLLNNNRGINEGLFHGHAFGQVAGLVHI
ncbi:MAG: hypothetical protein WCJ07_07005, partial [Verrucomicrobiota bacterium]